VAPKLTSINPASGAQGSTKAVTLTGTDLGGTASPLNVSGTGVTCTVTGTTTATSVSANCVITAAAATGARNVSVTTPGGTSNAVTFTVTVAPPATPSGGNATRGATGGPVTADLTWNAATGATSYDVLWSTTFGTILLNGGTTISAASTTNSYTFNAPGSMATGTTVYFKVRAVNAGGASNWSTLPFSSTVR